jgi:hypothetical protein
LHRDDRIAAECASHQLPRNKFSLFAWQAVAAMAALLHSCLDHQRMLMRRMQGRRSLLQVGPTSRTRDSVFGIVRVLDLAVRPYLAGRSLFTKRPDSFNLRLRVVHLQVTARVVQREQLCRRMARSGLAHIGTSVRCVGVSQDAALRPVIGP